MAIHALRARGRFLAAVALAVSGALIIFQVPAGAEPAVDLQTAQSFAVLAGAGVTNTGPSVINGDLGTCPTPAITGFPPGTVHGATHADDAVACQAQSDLTIAYNDAAGRSPNTSFGGPTDLGGQTLFGGVYNSPTSLAITGTLTLDAQNDPATVWIFQAGSTLITAPNSTVSLINGAQPCNVFWQVGSSATLGVGSTFVGSILALTAIAANTNATVQGRLLARNASVTLDTNTITDTPCAAAPPATTTTTAAPATTSTTAPGAPATTSTTAPGAPATTSTTAPGAPATTSTTAPGAPVTTSTTAPAAPVTTSTTAPPATTSTTAPATTATTAAPGRTTTPSIPTGIFTAAGAPTAGPTLVPASVGSGTGPGAGFPVLTATGSEGSPGTTAGGPLPATGHPFGLEGVVALNAIGLGTVLTVVSRRRARSRV